MDDRVPAEPAPAAVHIGLLGQFSIEVDGRRVPEAVWTSRRAKHLVQLLALCPDRALAHDHVLEALWADLEPSLAAANLREAAHEARRILNDPDAIALEAGVVRLFPGRDVATDADGFLGELLPEYYDDWTEIDRTRLRMLYLELLSSSGVFEGKGDPGRK